MTTLDTLSQRIRTRVMSGQREHLNRTSAALDDSSTTVNFEFDLASIQQGSVLSIDLEDCYVWSVNATNKTATVQRGWNGTTAAAHDNASIVHVNARITPFQVLGAVNDELRDLSSPKHGLFQIDTVDITFNASVEGYDLTSASDVIDVWEVRRQESGSAKDWALSKHWEWSPDMPASDFASGYAIWIKEGEPGQTVRVWLKKAFTTLSSLSQDVETVSGLPASAIDIPEIGAVMRLVATRDAKRNFTEAQPSPRRADEVPPGVNMSTAGGLRQLRLDRIASERARLNALYPRRRR